MKPLPTTSWRCVLVRRVVDVHIAMRGMDGKRAHVFAFTAQKHKLHSIAVKVARRYHSVWCHLHKSCVLCAAACSLSSCPCLSGVLQQMKQELKQPSPANKSSSAPKQARLLQLSLREIYMFEKVPGVSYKFVPDQREVDAALKLYADNNDPLESFMGVPVFQAEDLSIPLVEKV